MTVNTPIAARFQLPPRPPTTTNLPSGYPSILLQIRTRHRRVHPLDLSIGVHPRKSGQSGDADAWVGGARPGGRRAPSAESDRTMQEGG